MKMEVVPLKVLYHQEMDIIGDLIPYSLILFVRKGVWMTLATMIET